MKKALLVSTLFLALSCSMIPYAQAAPSTKGKKTAKSAAIGKKKAKAPAITEAKAKALLARKGITPDKYEAAFLSAVTSPKEYTNFVLLLAAGVDAHKARKWEDLPALAGEYYLSDAAKEQLRQEFPPLTVALLLGNERAARKLISLPGTNKKSWAPLEQAILKGNAGQIKKLLNSGADPYARGICGTFPVCLAAIMGKESCIKEIYSHEKNGEKANATDPGTLRSRLEYKALSMGKEKASDNTLTESINEGSVAEFRIALFSTDREWNTPENYPLWRSFFNDLSATRLSSYAGKTRMQIFLKEVKPDLPEAYTAVINNDMATLEKSLKTADKKALDGIPHVMAPLLGYAIATHHNDCLKILLDAGLSPDVITNGIFNGIRENMLMIAYGHENMKAFNMLVEKGANVSARADHGNTIINDLFREKDKKTLDYVMSQPSFKEEAVHPLMLALIKEDYPKIEELMSASSLEPELYAWDWRAYFDWVVARKDARALGLIYHSRLSDTSKCSEETLDEIKKLSEAPAFLATKKESTAASIDPDTTNPDEAVILLEDAAARNSVADIRKYLAIAGVNANGRSGHPSPLMRAAEKNATESIKHLLSIPGIDINAQAWHGEVVFTALDFAIQNKHTEAAELLRKAGAKTKAEM